MADIIIKVSTEALLTQTDRVKSSINSVENQFAIVGDRVRNAVSYWEGASSDIHLKKYEKLRQRFELLSNSLKKRPDDLLKIAGLYQETEQSAVEKAGSLPGNILI